MAEDACVFLVSGRIGGNLPKLHMVSCVGGLKDHDAVLGVQSFFYGVQGFSGKALFYADACEGTEALRLNVNLAFPAFCGTDFLTVRIISPEKPFSIPAALQDGVVHDFDLAAHPFCFCRILHKLAELGVFLAVLDEHTGDKHGFRHGPLAGAEGLEGFSGMLGEAV